jgi:hypothetical protein
LMSMLPGDIRIHILMFVDDDSLVRVLLTSPMFRGIDVDCFWRTRLAHVVSLGRPLELDQMCAISLTGNLERSRLCRSRFVFFSPSLVVSFLVSAIAYERSIFSIDFRCLSNSQSYRQSSIIDRDHSVRSNFRIVNR